MKIPYATQKSLVLKTSDKNDHSTPKYSSQNIFTNTNIL